MFAPVKHRVQELGDGSVADTCTCILEDLYPRLRKQQKSGADGAGWNTSPEEAMMDRSGVHRLEGMLMRELPAK